MTTPIVMGIDPGYDRVGWAVGSYNQSRKVMLSGYGCIQTSKKDSTTKRYQTILSDLSAILDKYQPSEVALESVFFSNNQKTAMQVAEARGLIIGCCLKTTELIFDYTPPQVKSAVTGNGAATKAAVAKMVSLQLGINTKEVIDDAVDAIAVLVTHLASRQIKHLTKP